MRLSLRPAARAASFLVVSAVLGACAAGPEVRTNQDPRADFSQYRTFGFVQNLGTDTRGRPSSLSPRLRAATTRELKARGLTFVSNNPDLLFDFYSGMQTGFDTFNQPIMLMPVRNYGSWAGYNPRFRPGDPITEGTLAVRAVDRRSNVMVWEGVAQDRVTQSMVENLDETVNGFIEAIFADFPR